MASADAIAAVETASHTMNGYFRSLDRRTKQPADLMI